MSVRAGAIMGLVAKWLVVPVSLGLGGYYFIGPKLAPPEETPVVNTPVETGPDDGTPKKRFTTGPEVEISASRSSRANSRKRKKARRHSSSSVARETAPSDTPPVPDQENP